MGFLGKLFGLISFTQHFWEGKLPLVFGLHNITNDLIWLIPFAVMLYQAYRGGYVKLEGDKK